MSVKWGDLERRGISLSRVEEARGWLGRHTSSEPQPITYTPLCGYELPDGMCCRLPAQHEGRCEP